MNNSDTKEIQEYLKQIITCDGIGKKKKTEKLMFLLENLDEEVIIRELKEIVDKNKY